MRNYDSGNIDPPIKEFDLRDTYISIGDRQSEGFKIDLIVDNNPNWFRRFLMWAVLGSRFKKLGE